MKTLTLLVPPHHSVVFTTVLLLLGLAKGPVHADTHIWDGSSSGYWGTGANWNTGTVPQDGDDLVFPVGPTRLATTNNTSSTRRYNSITLSGANYALRGNSLTLSNGISATYGAGSTAWIEMDITLAQTQAIECTTDNSILYVTGDIALGGYRLLAAATGNMLFGGAISGTGDIAKYGSGSLRLYGSTANTYTGTTVVHVGTLEFNKTLGVNAMGGDLVVGNNTGDPETAQWLNSAQLPGTTDVTVNEGAVLDLNNFNEALGRLTLNAGNVETGSGTLTLGGNVTATCTADSIATIRGKLSLGTATRTFEVVAGYFVPQVRVFAAVSGSGGITKTGTGQLSLAGTNTYQGLTTVASGTLLIESSAALGGTTQGTVVPEGSMMFLSNDVHVGDEPLSLAGQGAGGYSGYGVLTQFGTKSNSWAGPITLTSPATVWIQEEGVLNFTGPVSGAGDFTKKGPGTLVFSGPSANTFAGNTVVNEGTLALGKNAGTGVAIRYGTLFIGDGVGGANADVVRLMADNQLWSTVPIVITNSGWLDLNGHDDIVGPLSFSAGRASSGEGGLLRLGGNVTANYVSSGRPTIEGDVLVGATRTFNIANSSGSPDLELQAVVSGDGGFTKTGAGALGIYSANSFTGTVTINDGLVYLQDNGALGSTAGGTVVNDGGVLVLANNRDIDAEPLTLNGNGDGIAGALTSIGGSNSWSGTVTLETDSVITVQTNRYLNLCGVVAGPAGFFKGQPGTLILSGEAANTFDGNAVVNEGTLLLDKQGTDHALPGPGELVIGDGVGGIRSDIVREMRDYQIASSVNIMINVSGKLDLDGHMDTVGGLKLFSSSVWTGAGELGLAGDVWATTVTNFVASISGRLWLGTTTRVFDITNSNPAATAAMVIEASVSGAGGLRKVGQGSLYLSGSNSFEGLVTVAEGMLGVDDDHAMGITNAGTVVEQGAVLGMNRAHVGDEPLTIHSAAEDIALRHLAVGHSNSWAGPITLAQDVTIQVAGVADVLNLRGPLGGPGGIQKIGDGTLVLSGTTANTYSGTTFLRAGKLVLDKSAVDGAVPGHLIVGDGNGGAGADVVRLEHNNQIANEADVGFYSSGLLDLNGYYDRVNAVSGHGAISLPGGHLVAGHSGTSFTFAGPVSGTGYLWKVGGGTWTLTADNTYTGTTLIETGTLLVHGSQPTSDVTIGSAGILGGIGTVGRVTCTGGVLAPGVSPGTLTSSNLLFDSASDFLVELTDTGTDQLNVRGKVGLADAHLVLSAASLLPTEGQEFIIINNDEADAVTGTFAGLAEGTLVVAGPRQFHITYAGGTGNDVVLIATNTALLAPSLTIRDTGTNTVVIAWPLSDLGWLLQATTNLATAPVSWTELPPPYQTNGANLQCIEPSTTGHMFYRLHQP